MKSSFMNFPYCSLSSKVPDVLMEIVAWNPPKVQIGSDLLGVSGNESAEEVSNHGHYGNVALDKTPRRVGEKRPTKFRKQSE